MIHKTHHGLYQSSIISDIPGIIHGFTSKANGSMENVDKRNDFFAFLGLSSYVQISGKQVHGNSIHVVSCEDKSAYIHDVDGFVYKKTTDCQKLPLLAVHVGDCIPIVLVDPVAGVVGALHAGWRGTRDHIVREAMRVCMKLGAKPSDMRVAIGPYIHSCCYQVDEERAKIFEREFPGERGIVNRSGVSWFIDIGKANMIDLHKLGITKNHIDYNDELCTHCNPMEFYSYRRKTEAFGEIMGFIGFIETV